MRYQSLAARRQVKLCTTFTSCNTNCPVPVGNSYERGKKSVYACVRAFHLFFSCHFTPPNERRQLLRAQPSHEIHTNWVRCLELPLTLPLQPALSAVIGIWRTIDLAASKIPGEAWSGAYSNQHGAVQRTCRTEQACLHCQQKVTVIPGIRTRRAAMHAHPSG